MIVSVIHTHKHKGNSSHNDTNNMDYLVVKKRKISHGCLFSAEPSCSISRLLALSSQSL